GPAAVFVGVAVRAGLIHCVHASFDKCRKACRPASSCLRLHNSTYLPSVRPTILACSRHLFSSSSLCYSIDRGQSFHLQPCAARPPRSSPDPSPGTHPSQPCIFGGLPRSAACCRRNQQGFPATTDPTGLEGVPRRPAPPPVDHAAEASELARSRQFCL